jgi:hypothetical protein
MTYKMIVRKMSFEKTRVKYFGEDPEFYVISLLKDAYHIIIGDEIEYEPKAISFGWFIKKVANEIAEKDVMPKPVQNILKQHINRSATLAVLRKNGTKADE